MKHKVSLFALIICLAAVGMTDHHPDDPWDSSELLLPATLAARLKTFDPAIHIICVDSSTAFRSTHIPRALFAGPGKKARGLNELADAVKNLPHDAEIIVYCGCCPFVRCPNIRPAYHELRRLGFTHLKVLHLTTSLNTDWLEKGYPVDLSTH